MNPRPHYRRLRDAPSAVSNDPPSVKNSNLLFSRAPSRGVSSGTNQLLPLSQFSSISILASNCRLSLLVIGYILFLCVCAYCVLLCRVLLLAFSVRNKIPKSLLSGLICSNRFNCWPLFPFSSISILTSNCRLSLLIFSNILFRCGCAKLDSSTSSSPCPHSSKKVTRIALVWFNL